MLLFNCLKCITVYHLFNNLNTSHVIIQQENTFSQYKKERDLNTSYVNVCYCSTYHFY